MIKEALEFLAKSANASQAARILDIPGEPRKVFIDQGGTLTEQVIPPAIRHHKVDSVADLVNAAKTWNTAPVIWCRPNRIVLVTDDGDRRDDVTLDLTFSGQFAWLKTLAKARSFDQQKFITELRTNMLGAEKRAELITAVRTLKWRRTDNGGADIQHGKESLGRTIENEITGASAIPELVVVTCPVYANEGEDANLCRVGVNIDIDAVEQEFSLCALTDELPTAERNAIADIRNRIAEALPDVTILFGQPQ